MFVQLDRVRLPNSPYWTREGGWGTVCPDGTDTAASTSLPRTSPETGANKEAVQNGENRHTWYPRLTKKVSHPSVKVYDRNSYFSHQKCHERRWCGSQAVLRQMGPIGPNIIFTLLRGRSHTCSMIKKESSNKYWKGRAPKEKISRRHKCRFLIDYGTSCRIEKKSLEAHATNKALRVQNISVRAGYEMFQKKV